MLGERACVQSGLAERHVRPVASRRAYRCRAEVALGANRPRRYEPASHGPAEVYLPGIHSNGSVDFEW